jgi:hypothetical protein
MPSGGMAHSHILFEIAIFCVLCTEPFLTRKMRVPKIWADGLFRESSYGDDIALYYLIRNVV